MILLVLFLLSMSDGGKNVISSEYMEVWLMF